jgi:hypothetical protein
VLCSLLIAALPLISSVVTSSIALHQLVELFLVEFTIVTLTVLHVNLDLIMV